MTRNRGCGCGGCLTTIVLIFILFMVFSAFSAPPRSGPTHPTHPIHINPAGPTPTSGGGFSDVRPAFRYASFQGRTAAGYRLHV